MSQAESIELLQLLRAVAPQLQEALPLLRQLAAAPVQTVAAPKLLRKPTKTYKTKAELAAFMEAYCPGISQFIAL